MDLVHENVRRPQQFWIRLQPPQQHAEGAEEQRGRRRGAGLQANGITDTISATLAPLLRDTLRHSDRADAPGWGFLCRGCVTTMLHGVPDSDAASNMYCGNCVVLPQPVSPSTIKTLCTEEASRNLSRYAYTGKDSRTWRSGPPLGTTGGTIPKKIACFRAWKAAFSEGSSVDTLGSFCSSSCAESSTRCKTHSASWESPSIALPGQA
mmetsp:Transcript_29711/g.98460  ORF Transcript_29711/g.98460 Transcript_29711/m.98460 type:complete len:208 (+) Transcript_29711:2883-3506(+)